MSRYSTSLLLCILLAALFLAAPLRGKASTVRDDSTALASLPSSLEKRNTNAFARLLGELRIGTADILFVKTEVYLHGGIGYAAHTDDLSEGAKVLGIAAPTSADRDSSPAHPHTDQPDEGHASSASPLLHSESSHDHHDFHEHEAHDLPSRSHASHGEHDGPVDRHSGGGGEHTHDNEHASHSEGEGVSTTIRNKAEDFRWILGDLERAIKPWRDPSSPHILTGGTELLPWFRLMTIANPHYIRAYKVGAMWLDREDKPREALEFLEDGLELNTEHPERFQLYLAKVQVLSGVAREDGGKSYPEALEAARAGLQAGLKVRPEGGETGKIHKDLLWTPGHEEDLLFLARFESVLLDRLDRPREALAAVRKNRQWFPKDGALERIEQGLRERLQSTGD